MYVWQQADWFAEHLRLMHCLLNIDRSGRCCTCMADEGVVLLLGPAACTHKPCIVQDHDEEQQALVGPGLHCGRLRPLASRRHRCCRSLYSYGLLAVQFSRASRNVLCSWRHAPKKEGAHTEVQQEGVGYRGCRARAAAGNAPPLHLTPACCTKALTQQSSCAARAGAPALLPTAPSYQKVSGSVL